jgi:CheY-like chemotaxis protein
MSASHGGAGAGRTVPRVMIVDDDPDIRLLLQVVLGGDGLEVVGEAGNGEEALGMAHARRPEVIVLDQDMPVMTGEETAPALRRLLPDVRIVAYSASFTGKPVWADDYVAKEDFADLAHCIHRAGHVA